MTDTTKTEERTDRQGRRDKEDVRQGYRVFGMPSVLVISTSLALIALFLVWFLVI